MRLIASPIAEPDRRRHRHLSVDAGAAGRPGGLFRRAGRHAEAIEEIRAKLGLDQPLPEQFVRYVGDLAAAISAPR
jgi:hypothetical protein